MTPRRVAIIANQGFSLVNFRAELMRDLLARGHEVLAMAPDLEAGDRETLIEMGAEPVDISLSRTGLNPFRDLADIYSLFRTIRREGPDVVLGYAIKPVIYGTWAAALAKVPDRYALIAGLGYAFAPDKSLRQYAIHLAARLLYRWALSLCTCIFMQNPDDADDFVRMGIVPRAKICPVNGTGVNLDVWSVAPSISRPVTFLLAARLLPEKGVRHFAEAARRVKLAHPETRFILLGSIDANPSSITEQEVLRWVEKGILEWPGHVRVGPWLEMASVYVLPSFYREGVPRSIQEAMALGRPIITTDVPGCRETVIEGENGFLVAPRDVDALVAAMQQFVENPPLIETMGQKSRRLAEARFDVRSINAKMISAMGL